MCLVKYLGPELVIDSVACLCVFAPLAKLTSTWLMVGADKAVIVIFITGEGVVLDPPRDGNDTRPSNVLGTIVFCRCFLAQLSRASFH